MEATRVLDWLWQVTSNMAQFGNWLVSPIFYDIPQLRAFTPLTIFTVGGLTAFVALAIVKWVVS